MPVMQGNLNSVESAVKIQPTNQTWL